MLRFSRKKFSALQKQSSACSSQSFRKSLFVFPSKGAFPCSEGCRRGWVPHPPQQGKELVQAELGCSTGSHPNLETREPGPGKTEGWVECEGRNHPKNTWKWSSKKNMHFSGFSWHLTFLSRNILGLVSFLFCVQNSRPQRAKKGINSRQCGGPAAIQTKTQPLKVIKLGKRDQADKISMFYSKAVHSWLCTTSARDTIPGWWRPLHTDRG